MKKTTPFNSLVHHFLLPSPDMPDERFADALIYLCRHTREGAWGFIVNQPLPQAVGTLLQELDLPSPRQTMQTPAMQGGFVRPEAGFVLHTGLPDYASSFAVGENVSVTTSKDILNRICMNELPHYLLCMGFCSWRAGQLEMELADNDWLVCPADLSILFEVKFADRLTLAYQKLGLNVDKFAVDVGRA